jgi:hypothetical protein
LTDRYYDNTGTEYWHKQDQVYEQLTFFDREEKYKVIAINGQPVTQPVEHTQLGGATSSGEFGNLLNEIFTPETDAHFDWDHWGKLRGRMMYVFSYRVAAAHSRYGIFHQQSRRKLMPGYHGLVYADQDTRQVMRFTLECDDIPADFPIQQVFLTLDYEPTMIADREYILPLRSELRSREGRNLVKNETTFRQYRRYSADAVISFDSADPIPEDKLKEKKQ